MSRHLSLRRGDTLAGKYEIAGSLGAGVEGEVFRIRERGTGIERAAKVFFAKRNKGGRASRTYAKRLYKLRSCPLVVQYHTSEIVDYGDEKLTALISEYVRGVPLSAFLDAKRGKRLTPYEGLHLLHALTVGIESIHKQGEYHGDLHADNVLVVRAGLAFELKLLDLFYHGPPNRDERQWDVICMIQLFHEALGGPKHYSRHPKWVRDICRGLKHSLILERFKSATALRTHLEALDVR